MIKILNKIMNPQSKSSKKHFLKTNNMADPVAVTRYKINRDNSLHASHTIRIGLVTDLHENNPENILKALRKEKPDIILIGGDTMERNEEGYEGHTMEEIDSYQKLSPLWSRFCDVLKFTHRILRRLGILDEVHYGNAEIFLKKVSKIAPTYMSVGNHEWYFLPEDYDLMQIHNVILLDNSDILIEYPFSLKDDNFGANNDISDGNKLNLRIGGLSTRYDLDWLKRYSEKDGFKILLCHHPEYYEEHVKTEGGDQFDLVLAGHAHGGQWRFFGHGILAPGQGLFPKYHHGLYGKLLVSSGASNTTFVPRFGNPCEVVIIELGL